MNTPPPPPASPSASIIIRRGASAPQPSSPRVSGASPSTPASVIVDWVSQSEGFAPERPARLHLFDLGARGVMLVGLERPDSFDPPP